MATNLIRKIISGLSFTSMLFVFQACYGTPRDIGYDILVEGKVKSKETSLPIKGIKVWSIKGNQSTFTNEEGKFGFYLPVEGSVTLRFEDIDKDINGEFSTKDTTITANSSNLYIEIAL